MLSVVCKCDMWRIVFKLHIFTPWTAFIMNVAYSSVNDLAKDGLLGPKHVGSSQKVTNVCSYMYMVLKLGRFRQ